MKDRRSFIASLFVAPLAALFAKFTPLKKFWAGIPFPLPPSIIQRQVIQRQDGFWEYSKIPGTQEYITIRWIHPYDLGDLIQKLDGPVDIIRHHFPTVSDPASVVGVLEIDKKFYRQYHDAPITSKFGKLMASSHPDKNPIPIYIGAVKTIRVTEA